MIVYASPINQGTDIDGNTQKISVVGADKDELRVADMDQRDLLESILKQLKIMNIHLSIMTDNQIDKKDIGD